MIRKFEFTPDEIGKRDFYIIWNAFIGRGSDGSNPKRTPQSKSDHLVEAKISKALKSISNPVGEVVTGMILDTRPRQLKVDGGCIELEQNQFSRLQKFIEETQWSAAVVEEAVDTMERFDAADKIS